MINIVQRLSFLIFPALFLLLSNTVNAQIVLEAKDNGYTKGGTAADSNYYSDPSYLLRVRGSASDANKRRAYIKFDLSTVTQDFSKAELRITINRVVAITGGLINRSDIFTVSDDSWSEQTLTWNNAPPRVNYLFTQEYATKTSIMPDTVYSLDITDYVKSEYKGDKVVSICMVDTLNNGTDVRFWSNRSLLATGPQLILTTGPVGTANILSPAGGESWAVGSTQNITWTSSNITNMKIDFTTNEGGSWTTITESTPASAGSYSWNIPNANSSVKCKVRLSDADNQFTSVLSTGDFTILNNISSAITVSAPAAGENLIAGSSRTISWTSSYVSNVKLEYSNDNGGSWNIINPSVSSTALSYPWIVASTPSTQCKVRISDIINSSVFGETPVFSILGSASNQAILSANVFTKAGVSADSNYATDVLLRVRGSATIDNQRKTYLKFDMSGFTGTIDKAELKVTAYQVLANTSGPNRMDVFTVGDDSWPEPTITWNNSPLSGTYLFTQEFATKSTTQPDTTYPLDVTAYVKGEFAGDKIVSFCLTDTTNNNTDIRLGSNRGYVTPPQLVLYSVTGINDKSNNIPKEFGIHQNYPNPFNPSTKISYSIPKSGQVKITIYDILGSVVTVLSNEVQNAGTHELVWNASSYSSGVYFYRVQYGEHDKTTKMILMK